MFEQANIITERLAHLLKRYYAYWQITDLSIAGFGMESLVYRAKSNEFGSIAIKVPWKRWIPGDEWAADKNNSVFDSRTFLYQEVELATHLREYGVPIPGVYALHIGNDDFDFIVSEFIDHDQSQPNAYQFGQLMKALHDSPPPNISLFWNRNMPLNVVLAQRMSKRVKVIEKITNIQLKFPALDELLMILGWSNRRESCLHMDARPANILTRAGKIYALIDWVSAMKGDPALELARIAEFGYLSDAFLDGYSGTHDIFEYVPRRVTLLYRLDTAIMLSFVFLSLAPDPQQAPIWVRRVNELVVSLKSEIS